MSRPRTVVAVLFVLAAGASFARDVTVTPDAVYGHQYGMASAFDGVVYVSMVPATGVGTGSRPIRATSTCGVLSAPLTGRDERA